MFRRRLTLATLGFALLAPHAGAETQKTVTAADGWIHLPSPGATSATAFVVIDNPTMYDVYLVSATADVAETVQFREAGNGGTEGTVVKEVTAPAYSKVELKPGGTHLVLNGLKRPLKAGDVIPIVLSTDTAAMTVNATVKP